MCKTGGHRTLYLIKVRDTFSSLGEGASEPDIWSLFIRADKQKSSVCDHACVVHIAGNGRSNERKKITQNCKFGYFALALSDHVCANAHVFPSIALPGICDHQLPSADLRE